jgi:hypothetical protein
MYMLFQCTTLPNILLFSNAITTTSAWVRMTKMTSVGSNMKDLNKSLALQHATIFSVLFAIDTARAILLLPSNNGGIFNIVYFGCNLLYMAIILFGILYFIRSICKVRSNVGAAPLVGGAPQGRTSIGNKAGDDLKGARVSSAAPKVDLGRASMTSKRDSFLKKVNQLAVGMGTAMILGFVCLSLFTVGGNEDPWLYPFLLCGGMYTFLIASAFQQTFAMTTLYNQVISSDAKAAAQTGPGSVPSTIAL